MNFTYKRLFNTALGALFLSCIFISCSQLNQGAPNEPVIPPDYPVDPDDPSVPANTVYSREYWGEWIRIDNGDIYYFNNKELTINGHISTMPATYTRESDRVIVVGQGQYKYWLYASRPATSVFTGRVTDMRQQIARTAYPRSLGTMSAIIENLKNKADKQQIDITTTGQETGEFTVSGSIAGDDYQISFPDAPEVSPVVVRPGYSGDDIGTVTLSDNVNFKVSIEAADPVTVDKTRLYAGNTSYNFIIRIVNTGTDVFVGANISLLDFGGLVYTPATFDRLLGSMQPGDVRELPFTISCPPFSENQPYKNMIINIEIKDPYGRTWNDSMQLQFHKRPVTFNIKSERDVHGMIISSEQKAYPFNSNAASGYSTAITLPQTIEPYLVVFCGANYNTETRYSMGIDVVPDSNFSDFYNTGAYEPNDTVAEAYIIYALTEPRIMSYLHGGDIDYYNVDFNTDFNDASHSGPGLYQWGTKIGNQNLTSSLSYISSNAITGDNYAIILGTNETVSPTTLDYSGKNVSITVTGYDNEKTVALNSNGSIFTVADGVTLTLEKNITLSGRSNNNAPLIVIRGGNMVINNGAKINGNTNNNSSSYGGGVYVSNGTFTMNGGKIFGNTSSSYSSYSSGGGVSLSGGIFTMNGGEISGNTSSAYNNDTISSSYGGGVYVYSGFFTMNGGKISGNISSSSVAYYSNYSYSYSYGGGVYIDGGTFTMYSGEISANTSAAYTSNNYYSSAYGGGVYVSSGTFTMYGGEISYNTSTSSYYETSSYGGGICIGSGIFTMNGGKITGNTSSSSCYSNSNGGGVYISNGTFTINNGEISGNTSYSTYSYFGTFYDNAQPCSNGGGVCIGSGTFNMNGGEITDNTSSSLSSSSSYSFSFGGGVYIGSGTFTINNGNISGNTSSSYSSDYCDYAGPQGGGVYIEVNNCIFKKTGGTIFGYQDGNSSSNVTKDGSGIVLQGKGHAIQISYILNNSMVIIGKRDTTSGPMDNLSYDGTINPPVLSGEWDY